MSDFTSTVTIDKKEYQFELLDLEDAIEIESKIVALIAQTMGKGEKDHKLLFSIGKKVCANLCVDGFEVKDINEHFRGKALLFNKATILGVKANFPDLFDELKKKDALGLTELLKKSGLASAA
ncbi:MAG: hypothetical protein Unbinned3818contig1000_52 [Prokaryotic dsDNA virus sp.]|nr:hypothetical protein [Phycisphaerae bacterium]QDP45981.1 MAG: hypothetical protein Unbinned3818contig1000_52 [Prokaryotic dsDNA virus sp.]